MDGREFIGQPLLYKSTPLMSDPLLTKDGAHLEMGWANNTEGQGNKDRSGP